MNAGDGSPTSQPPGITGSHPLAGHLFDLNSLSGSTGHTAAYSEKGLVFISICGENENCAPGVGECAASCRLSLVPKVVSVSL